MDHASGVVVGQVEVALTTNEIPMLSELLGQFDIRDSAITVDALHTQRAEGDGHVAELGNRLTEGGSLTAEPRDLSGRARALRSAAFEAP